MIPDVLSIVSIGLLVGTEFAVSAFINPILAKLEPSAEAHATSLFAKKLGFVMPRHDESQFLGKQGCRVRLGTRFKLRKNRVDERGYGELCSNQKSYGDDAQHIRNHVISLLN